MIKRPIRVLVADDSALMRRVIKELLTSEPGVEVLDTARDGEVLLEKARELRPDVITLDINMPRMDGLTALAFLIEERIAPVVMLSSLTREGAAITLEALELGAFDCVAKPGGTVSSSMEAVRLELLGKVRAAAHAGILRRLTRRSGGDEGTGSRRRAGLRRSRVEAPAPVTALTKPGGRVGHRAVAIGISTGGPKTIFEVLPKLPAKLPAAVFLVQHLPPHFTATFAERLDKACAMRCMEARSGMVVQPGCIYLGQGGRHLGVVRKGDGEVVLRTPVKPLHAFMPSVDVMMQSVLDVYGADTVGVLMTGMGDDGAQSMLRITQAGGHTVAESEESAVVWGMPGTAVALGGARVVAPSWKIAEEIVKAVI